MWRIEYDPTFRLLSMRLAVQVPPDEMLELLRVHEEALDATGGQAFKVFADLRRLAPLEPAALSTFANIKDASAAAPGFRGMAILVDSPTLGMQQRRTRADSGRDDSLELVTHDEFQARRFLGP